VLQCTQPLMLLLCCCCRGLAQQQQRCHDSAQAPSCSEVAPLAGSAARAVLL
jgi:hypothetical protein